VPADFPANLATIAPVPAPMAVAVPRPAAVPAVVVVHEREADDRNADARGIGGPVDDLAADRPGEIPGVDPAAVAVPFDVTPAVAGRAAVHRHRDAARNCGDDAVVRACADTQIQVHGDLSHLLRLRHARHAHADGDDAGGKKCFHSHGFKPLADNFEPPSPFLADQRIAPASVPPDAWSLNAAAADFRRRAVHLAAAGDGRYGGGDAATGNGDRGHG